MKIQYRIPLFSLLGAAAATACLERIDSSASSGQYTRPGSGGGGGAVVQPRGTGGSSTASQGGSRGTGGSASPQGGAGGMAPEPDAGGPVDPPPPEEGTPADFTTRDIEFTTPDGAALTTRDPCEATTTHVLTIFTRHCRSCHGGGPGQMQGVPPFTKVLDFEALLTLRSASTPDPLAPPEDQTPMTPNFQGMRFVVPGDPANSRIYLRISKGEMPPDQMTIGALHPPSDDQKRPTASDLSVVHEWISHCVEEPEGDPGEEDGGAGDDADPGDPGDDGGADPQGDAGAGPDPAPPQR